MTNGAHDGVVNNPVTNNTGDDGVSVVSYVADRQTSHDITVNSPVVNGTSWGRGVTVVGGRNITYHDVKVSDTNGAGVYVASEPSYDTLGVSNVTINGGTVTRANYNAGVVHGAVLVYSGNPGQPVTGVTIKNLAITGTPATAQRNIGLITEAGSAPSGIVFANLRIDSAAVPLLYTNALRSSFTATGLTVAGSPRTVV